MGGQIPTSTDRCHLCGEGEYILGVYGTGVWECDSCGKWLCGKCMHTPEDYTYCPECCEREGDRLAPSSGEGEESVPQATGSVSPAHPRPVQDHYPPTRT